MKRLTLFLGLLVFSASVCFGNEIRASDFTIAFLQTAIMYVVVIAIMNIWNS